MKKLSLRIEELEQRIAPDVAPGLLGYEGHSGNQGGGGGNNNPVPAGAQPQPKG